MLKPFLISILFLAIAMAFFSVRLLLLRNGSFRSMHIHDNEEMRKRGIDCVIEQDRQQRTARHSAISERQK